MSRLLFDTWSKYVLENLSNTNATVTVFALMASRSTFNFSNGLSPIKIFVYTDQKTLRAIFNRHIAE